MTIHYKCCYFKLPLKDGIKIRYLQTRSLCGRIKRFISRIIDLKKIAIVLVCALIFVLIVVPIGLKLNVYHNWYDGIWDLRIFFLSSIFIVVVGNIIENENKRHKTLIEQLFFYYKISDELEEFIKQICTSIGFQYKNDILFTRNNFDIFVNKLDNYNIFNDLQLTYEGLNRFQYAKLICDNFVYDIKEYRAVLSTKEFILPKNNGFESPYASIVKQTESYLIVVSDVKGEDDFDRLTYKFIKDVVPNVYQIVSDIRHPWRSHFVRDEKIRELLREGKCLPTKSHCDSSNCNDPRRSWVK